MKKSLIVIALALLMIVPVFADGAGTGTTAPVNVSTNGKAVGDSTPLASATKKDTVTEVGVTLDLYPIYYTAITNINVAKEDDDQITRDNYTDSKYNNTKLILMTVNNDTYKLNPSGTYYVSYFFYENTEDVTLNVNIDSNLTTTADAAASDTDAVNYIRYIAVITNADSTTTTLHSDQSQTHSVDIAHKAATRKVADSDSHSFAFSLYQESGDTLEKNIAGYYTSTITLSLKAE